MRPVFRVPRIGFVQVADAAEVHAYLDEGGTLADFGQEAFGFLEFTPPKGTRGAYEVWLGELVTPEGGVNRKPGATIRAVRVAGTIAADGVHRVPLPPDARNTSGGREGGAIPIPPEHGVILPFRYAEVVSAPFAVTRETVRMVAVNYPIDMAASAFTCDNADLVKVYDFCKHSILATSFAGLYVDGDRERIPYEADAYLNQLSDYAVHPDPSLARASLVYLMAHPTWPTEWKQHAIKMAWADWMWTGDTRALGRTADAAAFAADARTVHAAFQKVFFDPARRVYRDGEGTDHASLHANAAALAFGLVPRAHRQEVVSFCASRGMACSVYFAQYLLEAFFEAGRADLALALMTATGDRSWLGMLDQGATITMEAWAPKYKPNLDLNHAWGTAPINVLARYVLGVTPLEPGFRKIRIAPQVGDLRHVAGTVPTVRGPVKVSVVDNEVLTVETPAPGADRVRGAGAGGRRGAARRALSGGGA